MKSNNRFSYDLSKFYPFLLLLYFVLNFAILYWWTTSSTLVLRSEHYLRSIEVALAFSAGYEKVFDLWLEPFFYPPLLYYVSAVFLFLFRISKDVYLLSNFLVFGSLLLFSTYSISKKLFSPKVGFFSGIIVFSFFSLQAHSHWGLQEFPLAAWVSFSIFMILWAFPFNSAKRSVLLGFVFGLGLLLKQLFLLYLFGPIVLMTLLSILPKGERFHRVLNIVLILLVTVVTAGLWYLPNFVTTFQNIVSQGIHIQSEPILWTPKTFSVNWLLFYPRSLWKDNILSTFFILFLLGCIFSFRYNRRSSVLLHTWIFGSFLLFLMVPMKIDRYMLPLLPAVAIVCALPLDLIKNKIVQFAYPFLIIITVLFLFLSYYLNQFNNWIVPYYTDYFYNHSLSPEQDTWKVNDIVSDMVNNTKWRHPILIVLNQQKELTALSIKIRSYERGVYLQDITYMNEILKNVTPAIMRADFVVVKERSKHDEISWSDNENRNRSVLQYPSEEFLSHFKIEGIYSSLPDGSKAVLYKRNDNYFNIIKGDDIFRDEHGCNINNQILFMGMEIVKEVSDFKFILRWKCISKIRESLTIFVHFQDSQTDEVILGKDHHPLNGRYLTNEWKVGEIIKETYFIKFPDSVNSTHIDIYLGVCKETSKDCQPLVIRDTEFCPNLVGDRIKAGVISID